MDIVGGCKAYRESRAHLSLKLGMARPSEADYVPGRKTLNKELVYDLSGKDMNKLRRTISTA